MNQNQFQTLLKDARQLQASGDFGAAIQKASQANQLDPGAVEPYYLLGQLYRVTNKAADSVRLFRMLFEHFPDDSDVMVELASSIWAAGDQEEAYKTAKKILDLKEVSAFALETLGRMATTLERWPIATEAFQKLDRQHPDQPLILRQWYFAHRSMFQFEKAAEVFERILKIEGETAENLFELGKIYFDAQKFEKARDGLEKALALDPENVQALYCLARCKIQFGDIEGGVKLAKKMIAVKPEYMQGHGLLNELKPEETSLESIKQIENTLGEEDSEGDSLDRAYGFVLLGQYYHKQKNPDKAFQHFKTSNEIRYQAFAEKGVVYSPEIMEANFAETKKVFSRQALSNLKGCGSKSDVPVFIVAMPRSGTTLLEQIIASHSKVFGAGEMSTMVRLFFNLNYKINEAPGRDIHDIIRENAKEWADTYLESLESPAGVLRVTDKLPINFIYLGLIEAMFPNARVIQIKRHPLDCCLSIYSNSFSDSYAFSTKLDTLGHYYNLYADLMDYWKKTLSLKFFELQYEDLVADTEGKAREVLDFCGLEWEDKVLEFYKGRKAAYTISQVQVSQPINTKGMGRWKPYREYIGPLIEALDEDIVGPLGVKK